MSILLQSDAARDVQNITRTLNCFIAPVQPERNLITLILHAIRLFLFGRRNQYTEEELSLRDEVSDTLIAASEKFTGAPERLDLKFGEDGITLSNSGNDGVSISVNNSEAELIPDTQGLSIAHLIAGAKFSQHDNLSQDLVTERKQPSECHNILTDYLKTIFSDQTLNSSGLPALVGQNTVPYAGPINAGENAIRGQNNNINELPAEQENGFVLANEAEEDQQPLISHWDSGNTRLASPVTIKNPFGGHDVKFDGLTESLNDMRQPDMNVVVVVPLADAQNKMLGKSNHFVTAVIPYDSTEKIVILDSKDTIAYPEEFTVIRTDNQDLTDTFSCAFHAIRAALHAFFQLQEGIQPDKLTACPPQPSVITQRETIYDVLNDYTDARQYAEEPTVSTILSPLEEPHDPKTQRWDNQAIINKLLSAATEPLNQGIHAE